MQRKILFDNDVNSASIRSSTVSTPPPASPVTVIGEGTYLGLSTNSNGGKENQNLKVKRTLSQLFVILVGLFVTVTCVFVWKNGLLDNLIKERLLKTLFPILR
jgi:hypothetical protein